VNASAAGDGASAEASSNGLPPKRAPQALLCAFMNSAPDIRERRYL
jgi:hypothetical protein